MLLLQEDLLGLEISHGFNFFYRKILARTFIGIFNNDDFRLHFGLLDYVWLFFNVRGLFWHNLASFTLSDIPK